MKTVRVEYNTKAYDMLEFAVELGERFPDMTNSQIILACEEYNGKIITDNRMREAVVIAYDNGLDKARDYLKARGYFG